MNENRAYHLIASDQRHLFAQAENIFGLVWRVDFSAPGFAALDVPASTTGLAHLLGISPAGVSAHLTAMRAAGLVRAHRAGRSVLYMRTDAANALLAPAR